MANSILGHRFGASHKRLGSCGSKYWCRIYELAHFFILWTTDRINCCTTYSKTERGYKRHHMVPAKSTGSGSGAILSSLFTWTWVGYEFSKHATVDICAYPEESLDYRYHLSMAHTEALRMTTKADQHDINEESYYHIAARIATSILRCRKWAVPQNIFC